MAIIENQRCPNPAYANFSWGLLHIPMCDTCRQKLILSVDDWEGEWPEEEITEYEDDRGYYD